MIIVFVIGLPLGAIILLWRRRTEIKENKDVRELRFLYDGYHPSSMWW
jgi:hypothetical protein